ncbi:MAG TPA: phenylalanine--tRNA ligase subunit beta [Bacteroidia bacterium]|nr:phenylalanine--tRNA ligase subunit beta [Bacteroidia bacterium]HNT80674.1 phenylalanine--tRNA ligase subunit beta [Bacteroidia bacterium]
MKISYNWLNEYLSVKLEVEHLTEVLTSIGLEVESFEKVSNINGGLEGLLVGHVIEKEKHPDADRLNVTKVNIGQELSLQIVCGAPNVAVGQKVIVAPVGTMVHPVSGESFEIRKAKIRGVVSEGMICSASEVSLSDESDGIHVLESGLKEGTMLTEVFEVKEDYILEIGLTPNRVDAASHIGVARDLNAWSNYNDKNSKVILPESYSLSNNQSKETPIDIHVEDQKDCPRYSGICINNIEVKPSPQWLADRLKSVGIRPVNNLVDIGNYVMFELGQPLHFFDLDKIEGNKIEVKKLSKGTLFKTLDEVERKLSGDELMICNAQKPMCIAGVFGGADSGITNSTKNIFIESAKFNASLIRIGSKKHGLKTEASYRFERGTDVNTTVKALERAVQLVLELAGGTISSKLYDCYPESEVNPVINYSVTKSSELLGFDIGLNKAEKIFHALGYPSSKKSEDALEVNIPSYKTDIFSQADLDEEVLRMIGYDKIPLKAKANHFVTVRSNATFFDRYNDMANYCRALGFVEIMNNSMTGSINAEKFWNKEFFVQIKNPLSNELDLLRPSLIISGLESIQYNLNRKQENLKLFEFGKCYSKNETNYKEEYQLSLFFVGKKSETNWLNPSEKKYDFFDIKNASNELLERLGGGNIKLELHHGDSDDLYAQKFVWKKQTNEVATFGLLSKKLCKVYDVQVDVWTCVIDLQFFLNQQNSQSLRIKPVGKFPEVKRDLSMLLDESISYDQLKNLALQTDQYLLKQVDVFDVYKGDKIESGKKSYALSFVLQDQESTLDEQRIEAVMKKLMSAFENKLGAVIRKA